MNRDRARLLRQNGTEAEHALWRCLRDRALAGSKFRRQVPLGPFIADFVCFERKLIVEVDGGQHADGTPARRDAARTAWLEAQGYRVVRFWNNDVLSNPDGVLEALRGLVEAA
jgi:very-short-patch-repair endonuclease